MIDAISSALSGLYAATRRVDAAASNIANASSANYTPVTTVQTANTTGGASAVNVPKPVSLLSGLPEVDFAEEAVNLKLAEISYKANISVMKTVQDMQSETLKLFDEKA